MNPSPFLTPIGMDQHAIFFGTTGSGKTYRTTLQIRARLALLQKRQIYPNTYKIIILDTKPVGWGEDDQLGNFVPLVKREHGMIVWDWEDIQWGDDHYLYVYRVMGNAKNPDNFNQMFLEAQNRTLRTKAGKKSAYPFLLVVDELIDIAATDRNRVTYIHGLTSILSLGRAAGQTVWIETQTPTYVYGDLKRLTTCRFVFRLPEPQDRKYVADMIGDPRIKQPIPDPYGFYYQNDLVNQGRVVYFNGHN